MIDEHGFDFRESVVTWAAIKAIATYKLDLGTYDEICLAFKVADGSWVEVVESAPGFSDLMAEVDRRFPEIPRDWYRRVMLPAFATNYRVLWGADQ